MARPYTKTRMVIPYLVTKPLSHSQEVCRLYKAGLKVVNSHTVARYDQRLENVRLRKRFDDNRHIQDFRVAKQMLIDGWEEHDYERHYVPFCYYDSDGGAAFERDDIPTPDWLLDEWHPLEKAFYPDYFERREKRKQEFIDRWNNKYGTPTQEEVEEGIWYSKDKPAK